MSSEPQVEPKGVSRRSRHRPRYTLVRQHNQRAILDLFMTGEELVRDVQLAGSQNVVVSIGTPGVPDLKSGELQFVENIADLSCVPLVHVVQEKLGVLAYVEKDVNLAALGEQRNGCAQGCDNFAFISVGNGVGMGAITDGQPLLGARGAAITAVAVVLDPELVVLGGGIGSQPVVIDAARAALSAMYDHPVNVMGSALGTDSALVGAQAAGRDLVVQQIMESLG